MTYEKITSQLIQGPRLKTEATKDLEYLVQIFLDPDAALLCQYNSYGELEVKTNGTIYNLTQILKHQPDFEHLFFSNNTLKHYEQFIQTAKNRPSLRGSPKLPSPEEYSMGDNNHKYSHLAYAEKLAITLYTTNFYEEINPFLREHGQNESLTKLTDVDDLTQTVKEIVLGVCIASHGLSKLPSVGANEVEQLYRAENSKLIDQEIMNARTIRKNKPQIQKGFVSTSQSFDAMKLGQSDTVVTIYQSKNSMVKDVEGLSYKPDEREALLLPGFQLVFSDYTQSQRKEFIAVPVRSLDGIDPFSYSAKGMQFRGHLIEAKDILTKYFTKIGGKRKNSSLFGSRMPILQKTEEDKLFLMLSKLNKMIEVFANSKLSNKEKNKQLKSFYKEVVALHSKANVIKDKELLPLIDDLITVAYKIRSIQVVHSQTQLIQHARYVYAKYLSQAYKDTYLNVTDDKISLDGITIHRPNHGLVHSLRVATYILPVVDYFKESGQPEIKSFCAALKLKEIKNLQLCMLFSVSGRESDIDFNSDPKKYREYRKKCAEQFEQYAKELKMPSKDVKKYSLLILNMGNPDFLKLKSIDPEMRNLFHIMNLAHKLDLMRCFYAPRYKTALSRGHDDLVISSPEQVLGFNNLLTLVTRRIVATGDRIRCYFDGKQMVTAVIEYQKCFAEASSNPEKCIQLCMEPDRVEDLIETLIKEEQLIDLPDMPAMADASESKFAIYFPALTDYLYGGNKSGLKELDDLGRGSFEFKIKVGINGLFEIHALSVYSGGENFVFQISQDQLLHLISRLDPEKIPLPFDGESLIAYLNNELGSLGITELDKMDSSYVIKKIEHFKDPEKFKIVVVSEEKGIREVIISHDKLSELVLKQQSSASGNYYQQHD